MSDINCSHPKNGIEKAVCLAGGNKPNRSALARICGVTPATVRKWLKKGELPRTEHTGETKHAQKIARAFPKKITQKELKKRAVS